MSHQYSLRGYDLYSTLISLLVSKHRLRTKTTSDISQFYWACNVHGPHSPHSFKEHWS